LGVVVSYQMLGSSYQNTRPCNPKVALLMVIIAWNSNLTGYKFPASPLWIPVYFLCRLVPKHAPKEL
jgi:hypothetical protein